MCSSDLSDPIFAEIEDVKKEQAKEKKRIEDEKEKKRLEKERDDRNTALLAEMAKMVTGMETDLKDACIAALPEAEMAMMVIEQVKPVIEQKDIDSAPDMKTFVDDAHAQLEAAKATCAAAAPAPAAPGAPAAPADPAAPPAPAPAAPTP